MPLPFFYTEPISPESNVVALNEENSKHIVQVLRMQDGRQLKLTDGLGHIFTAEITEAHKKKCVVKIIDKTFINQPHNKICIAISPVKNNSRFEWFFEKATEIGVGEIMPLLCVRTEKQFLKFERLQGILISAMLQSQQAWLPVLHTPIKFEKVVKEDTFTNKYIAHCEEENKISLKEIYAQSSSTQKSQNIILIGPEGDFTKEEIALAFQNKFIPVSLGETRLRTETAGMVAATILCID